MLLNVVLCNFEPSNPKGNEMSLTRKIKYGNLMAIRTIKRNKPSSADVEMIAIITMSAVFLFAMKIAFVGI